MGSIKFKMIAGILICALLTGIAVGIVAIFKSAEVVKNEAYKGLASLSTQSGKSLEIKMNRIEGVIHMLNQQVTHTVNLEQMVDIKYNEENAAYNESLKPTVLSAAESMTDNMDAYVAFYNKKDHVLHTVLYIYNQNTQKFEDASHLVDPHIYQSETKSMQWYYTPLNTGKPFWSDLYFDDTFKIDMFSYTEPIIVNGVVIGVVGADIAFSDFKRLITEIKVYDTGYGFLLDRSKNLLVHPKFPVGDNVDKYLEPSVVKAIGLQQTGVLDYTLDGVSKVMGYHVLENNGWILGVAPPTAEIFKGVRAVLLFLIYLLGAMILLVSLISYQLGNRMTKPIVKITQVIEEISSGNYDLIIDNKSLTRKDEIGILGRAIDKMKGIQKDALVKLNDYAQTLEEKVNARTLELRKTNDYLEESLAENEEQQAMLTETNQRLEDSLNHLMDTQRQLIESEKIASLNYLMAGVAHELNTPVGNSITLVTYMQRELGDLSRSLQLQAANPQAIEDCIEESKAAYETLLRNLTTSKDLINVFKDLAVGRSQTEKNVVYVKEMLVLLIDTVILAKHKKTVTFDIQCDPDLTILCEPVKLARIFIELIENSIHHGFEERDSGRISIQISQKQSDSYTESAFYRIIYQDDGKGIDEELSKNIFTPFFSSKFSSIHNGLGLSMVYNLVKGSFNGDIAVNPFCLNGAEFDILLKTSI